MAYYLVDGRPYEDLFCLCDFEVVLGYFYGGVGSHDDSSDSG